MRVVYLHGFASSPQSSKARFFENRFAEHGVAVEVPRLDQGDFTGLTVTGQLEVIARTLDGKPSILMGSSLGGYLAALYASRHPARERIVEKLVLLAPALEFPSRWRERHTPEEMARWREMGTVPVYHYGYRKEVPLGYQLVEDSLRYDNEPQFDQPALIFHGIHDETVPVEVSKAYAARRANVSLKLLDSGHELTDQLEPMWAGVADFLKL